jgi:hypothetical protein
MVVIRLLAPLVLLVAVLGAVITVERNIAAVQVAARQVMPVLVVLVMLVAIAPLRVTLVQPTVAAVKVPVVAVLAV